jgi:hypothetical protein
MSATSSPGITSRSTPLRGLAIGDPAAAVEDRDAVAQAHHELHVVLDQQDGAAVAPYALEQRAQRELLGGIHAGGRLIEREQQRFGGQRAGDLEPALIAVRQGARRIAGVAGDADVVEQLHRALADRALLVALGAGLEHGAPDPGARAHVTADHHVLERAHLAEQPDVLEGAGDARARHCVHRRWLVGPAGELEAAGVGRVEPGDHVEEGGLAGAVGADEAVDLAALDAQPDVGQRLQAAEALADAGHGEQRRGRLICVHGGFSGRGAGRATAPRAGAA